MKQRFTLLLLTVFALAGYTFEMSAEEIASAEVTNSHCKNRMPPKTRGDYEDFKDAWSVEYADGKLVITWYNFWANCCPSGFESKLEREDNRLTLSTSDIIENPCDCNCPYDVTSSFENIEPGHYVLVLSPYNKDVEPVEVDLEEGFSLVVGNPDSSVKTVADGSSSISYENDVVTARCDGRFRLAVYSASGVLEYALEAEDSLEVSLGGLASGVCFVRLMPQKGEMLSLPILR